MAHTSTARPGRDEPHQDRGPTPSYVVPNSWEHARQRLELLEACYDASSVRRASTGRTVRSPALFGSIDAGSTNGGTPSTTAVPRPGRVFRATGPS